MSDNTREMLTKNMQGIKESLEEYARQIESGEYGDTWQVQSDPVDRNVTVQAIGDYEAIEAVIRDNPTWSDDMGDYEAERIEADEPTVDETPISEYPLEVVDERGREFAVVISTGGPHIEVVADGGQNARLAGYWGGEQVYLHGDVFDTFLDYFIER